MTTYIAGTPNAAGGMFAAQVGTALPTDVNSPIDPAFGPPLILSEEGLSRSIDKDTSDWRMWGGSVIRKISNGVNVEYSGEIIGQTYESLCVVFGARHVTKMASGTIKVEITAEDAPEQAFVFDMLDGDNIIRECVEKGQLIVSGEVKYNSDAPVGFPFTITALNPGNGVHVTTYTGKLAEA